MPVALLSVLRFFASMSPKSVLSLRAVCVMVVAVRRAILSCCAFEYKAYCVWAAVVKSGWRASIAGGDEKQLSKLKQKDEIQQPALLSTKFRVAQRQCTDS